MKTTIAESFTNSRKAEGDSYLPPDMDNRITESFQRNPGSQNSPSLLELVENIQEAAARLGGLVPYKDEGMSDNLVGSQRSKLQAIHSALADLVEFWDK